MVLVDEESDILPYRGPGAAADPPAHWWVVTSWAAFAAVLLIVIGGFVGLLQLARTGDADAAAILYPFTVSLVGLGSVTGLAVSSIAALWYRHRQLAKAVVPWVLATASCGMVFVLY